MPLAAGCSFCGADLDTARYDRGPGLLQQIGSWFSALSYGPRISIGGFLLIAVGAYVLLQLLG
jgi:hypothetical protein